MVSAYIDLKGIVQRNVDIRIPVRTENIDRSGILRNQEIF
jgi:hypothetical protein